MIKGCKVRLYPTKAQEELIWKHIGACRYIWNWMLSEQIRIREAGGKHLSAFGMNKMLTPLKNDGEHNWLYGVSNASLQVVCKDLEESYKNFFRRHEGFPKFKRKKNAKPNYPLRPGRLWFDVECTHVEKVGRVKYKTDFSIPTGKGFIFLNPRISNVNGKWMLSFGIECENQAPVLTDKSMGIDLGIKETMVVAYGEKELVFHNINKSASVRNLENRIKKLQRSIARKYVVNRVGNRCVKTRNIERQENQLRNLYTKVKNIRLNYIHQSTHKLVSLLPCKVVMEDLNVKGMMKNRHLAKAIQEQCFYEIIRQMKYKCEWNGIQFIQAERFFPSSKTCSRCGCVKRDLTLKDRIFVCPECGFTIGRDYQAALNLQRYEA